MFFRRPSLRMAAQGRENFEKLGFCSQTRLQSRLYLYHDDCGRYQKPQIYDYRGMYIKLVHIATDLRNNDHAVEMHGPCGGVSSKYEHNRDAPLTPVLKQQFERWEWYARHSFASFCCLITRPMNQR